ncbi:hypothetical protein [Mesorhizobium retamae]|uniref:Uncharacterized protein n=1 Tax=Mesorhizobium retamae TaxID=2912854 RepID=A0ABS9QM84_9HYPH|nr:hypothetical protein [Mesorhizobium sp. IRAMC:0171]MCG7508526.1 hypothetical protein [Mesorhizobium sp. IRAMC:0171]
MSEAAAIQKAAEWLANTPQRQRPPHLLAHLQHEFGLTAAQAVEAIREGRLMAARAH